MDRDGKCHWRVGSKIIDDESLSTYYGKYYCEQPPSEEEINKEVAPIIDQNRFRIPTGLVCKKHQSASPFETQDRIIGGMTAIRNSWPWIVNINFFGYSCGGTIIDDKTILTAAHCCKDRADLPQFITMTIGDHHMWNIDNREKKVTAERVILHPEYRQSGLVNDICILKFNGNGQVNLKSHNGDAACLPNRGEEPSHGTICWAAGWGLVNSPWGKSMPQELQEVDLQIYSNEECEKTQNSGYLRRAEHLCAGWPQGGKDGCQGDSGGPLICADEESQPVVVGVTSWGFGCAEPNSPGVWTKVSSYIDWIEENMN